MSAICHMPRVRSRNDRRSQTALGAIIVSAAILCATGVAQAQTLDLGGGTQALTTLVDPITSTDYVLVSNGLLQLTTATDQTFTGQLSDSLGVFGLEKFGAGTLTLTGTANDYSGGTLISQGGIAFASGNAFGTGPVTLADLTFVQATGTGATVANSIVTQGAGTIDSGAGTVTFSGPISGPGSITKTGTGTLVLTGANSFTNAGISAGTLAVGSSTALGIGGLSMADGTTLAAAADALVLANPISTAGAGTVDTAGFNLTLAGDISGPGSLTKAGAGTLTLSGTNSYVNTGISAGTLAFTSAAALGPGGISIGDGATLAAAGANITLGSAISVMGASTIDTAGFDLVIGAPILGPGSLTKAGAGTLSLISANSFGDLGISGGTVAFDQAAALGQGGISMADGTGLLALTNNIVVTQAISTAGAALIDTNGNTLVIDGALIGPGSFTKTGAGTLVLNGANSFGNGAIDTGTLVVGSNTALGVGGLSMGDGTTLQAGAADLMLGNAISSAGAAVIDTNGFMLTLDGSLLGPGSFTKIGAGNLVLNGDNSFTNFGLLAGTLTVGSDTALGGPTSGLSMADATTLVAGASATLVNPITTTGAGVIDTGANTLTLSGNIDGAGSLTKIGTGTLVLSGDNSFDNVGVSEGTLGVGSNTALGLNGLSMADATTLQAAADGLLVANDISTQGTLDIDTNGNDLTLGGAIVGPGSITKVGAGTLTLASSSSTFAGTTTVAAGQLDVTGVYNSAVTVQSGGAIGGTGVLGSVTLNAGSTIAPGASAGQVGTLTINNSLAIPAGSTFAVDLIGAQADRLNVGGTATLGGTLAVGVSNAQFNTPYTVLSANSVAGTFGSLAQAPSGTALVPVVSYTPTAVNLTITPGSLVNYLGGAGTVNQTNTAAALTAATAAGFNPQNFYGLYVGGGGAGLGSQLNQLSGELRSGERRTAISDTRYAREAALARLGPGVCTPNRVNATTTVTTEVCNERFAVWGGVIGAWGDYNGDGNGSHSTTHTQGVMAGGEMKYGPFKVGAFFNQTITHLDYVLLGGSSVKSIGGTGYIGWRPGGGLAVAAGGGYSQTDYRSSRTITVPGLEQTLTSSGGGDIWQLFGDIAWDMSWSPAYSAEPFARLAYVQSNTDPVAESGGYAAIDTLEQNYDTTFLTVGLRGAAHFGPNNAGSFSASAGWQHIWGDAVPTVSNALFGTSPTPGGLNYAQIQTVPMDDNAAAVEVAFKYRIGGMADVGIGYSGIIGNRYIDNALYATIGVGF